MPRLLDHIARRDEIIQAAWGLAAAGGVGAVTLRGVAHEAGIVVGSVRHIFNTRELLIASMAEELVAHTKAAARQHLAGNWNGEIAAARLANTLPFTGEVRLRWQVESALSVASTGAPRLAAQLSRCREIRADECATVVRAVVAGLALTDAQLNREITLTFALVEGLSYQLVNGGRSAPSTDEARLLLIQHLDRTRQYWRDRRGS